MNTWKRTSETKSNHIKYRVTVIIVYLILSWGFVKKVNMSFLTGEQEKKTHFERNRGSNEFDHLD